jgi:hypothetical protein
MNEVVTVYFPMTDARKITENEQPINGVAIKNTRGYLNRILMIQSPFL